MPPSANAGLDPTVELVAASSVTNDVWLTPTHVVRVNASRFPRLAREAALNEQLPAEVRHPRVLAHGSRLHEEWCVSMRSPGVPLAHAWPDLDAEQRRHAVVDLAGILSSLHATPVPAGLAPLEGTPQLVTPGAAEPLRALGLAIERCRALEHVDPGVLRDAWDTATGCDTGFARLDAAYLVHGDVTFENVLWHDGAVRALLDLEWARGAPADLDLDVLLRMCVFPERHVAAAHASRTHAEDYHDVPAQLARAYPVLFSGPHLGARLRLYDLGFLVRSVLLSPPASSSRHLADLHPYRELQRALAGRGHLDALTERGLLPMAS